MPFAGVKALDQLSRSGLRRIGDPERGFRYVDARGRAVPAAERARIEALVIPPAWREVRIASSSGARLQAIGRDRAGRWQYLYHPAQAARRERAKRERLERFIAALPRLRRRITCDLALPGLARDKVLAAIAAILASAFMRPGSEVYANENRSYGITTLRKRHVTVRGDRIRFEFRGKSGKEQVREIADRKLARIVRELLAVPGRDLFQFVDEEGTVTDVRRRHVNAWIKDAMGESFSAKDFRTFAGTLLCASALARASVDPPADARERQRRITAALRETAEALGNTPAVCRASYVDARVFERADRLCAQGTSLRSAVVDRPARAVGLRRCERELLGLLAGRPARARGRRAAPRATARTPVRAPRAARSSRSGARARPASRAARRSPPRARARGRSASSAR